MVCAKSEVLSLRVLFLELDRPGLCHEVLWAITLVLDRQALVMDCSACGIELRCLFPSSC